MPRNRYWIRHRSFDYWSDATQDYGRSEISSTGESQAQESPSGAYGSMYDPAKILAASNQATSECKTSAECMVCLMREPTCVFQDCGHLGVCGRCCKFLLQEQNMKNKGIDSSTWAKGKMKHCFQKLRDLRIHCPYCREKTRLPHLNQHKGATIYPV